jgi:hypothetical protein
MHLDGECCSKQSPLAPISDPQGLVAVWSSGEGATDQEAQVIAQVCLWLL